MNYEDCFCITRHGRWWFGTSCSMLANEYVKRGYQVAILLFAGNNIAYPLDERVEICIVGKPSAGNPFIQMNR